MADENDPIQAEESTAVAVQAPEAEMPPGEEGPDTDKKKLKQTVLITDVGPCRKHIKVTVEREDIDELFSEKYKELVSDSQVPGFRPGKAPKQIVVRKFKKDVSEQVRGQVLLASLEQLADDFDVAPLSPPDINPNKLDIPDKGPFIYEFEVEVRPQFELPNYRGLKLKRPVHTYSDDEVAEEEKRILSRYGSLAPKPEGNAQIGDFLTVDMTTRLGDTLIGTSKEITIRVDDTIAFKDGVAKGLAEKVAGANANDTRVVDIVMTDAAAQEGLKGKTVQATLEIKEVKTLRMPELDEEFLESKFGVRTTDQLRERVRVMLERRLEYQQRNSAREQVLELITASADWDLPRDLLLRQARKSFARRVMEMQEAGLSEEEIRARSRMLEQDVVKSTQASLKEHFVLQKIAEVEKIEVNDDDVNDEIERLADQSGESARRVRAKMEKDDLLETLAAQLMERLALNLILESAEYEDMPLIPEGGMATVDQQAIEGELNDPTKAPDEEPKAEQSSE